MELTCETISNDGMAREYSGAGKEGKAEVSRMKELHDWFSFPCFPVLLNLVAQYDHCPLTLADQPRRRRHRPAFLLRTAHGFSRGGGDRQIRLYHGARHLH